MNLSASHSPLPCTWVWASLSLLSHVIPPTSSQLLQCYWSNNLRAIKRRIKVSECCWSAKQRRPRASHILPLFYSLRAFLSWTLSRICNKVLSRRQEILEKSNNVMTILITFTVGAQLHICIASGSHWPRQEETIFTPGIQRLQTDVITLPIALFCCLFL